MAWCRHTPSNRLRQCWPSSMSSRGITMSMKCTWAHKIPIYVSYVPACMLTNIYVPWNIALPFTCIFVCLRFQNKMQKWLPWKYNPGINLRKFRSYLIGMKFQTTTVYFHTTQQWYQTACTQQDSKRDKDMLYYRTLLSLSIIIKVICEVHTSLCHLRRAHFIQSYICINIYFAKTDWHTNDKIYIMCHIKWWCSVQLCRIQTLKGWSHCSDFVI